MRILHILDHSPPLQSGYVVRTRGITEAQRAMGWTAFQMTTPRHAAALNGSVGESDCPVYRTAPLREPWSRSAFGEMAATARRIVELARELRPDILHAHSPVLNGLPALWAGRRLDLPVVYEVRAFWEDAAVENRTARGNFRYAAVRWLETRLLHRADAVTALCQGVRDEIVARGVPAGRVTVIPNAVDTVKFAAGRQRDEGLARRLGLNDGPVLGFLGSFYPYEGLDLLIRAMPSIAARHPGCKLLLVGGGPEEERLRAMAPEGTVIFVGRVPHDQVRTYYDLVDLFVYPRYRSRLTDLVTPLKPLEAMARERVVLASDVGGHREMIEDGRTGFLFKAGDAGALVERVAEILSASGHWARIGQAARRDLERERTWATSAGRYAGVYESALARSGGLSKRARITAVPR